MRMWRWKYSPALALLLILCLTLSPVISGTSTTEATTESTTTTTSTTDSTTDTTTYTTTDTTTDTTNETESTTTEPSTDSTTTTETESTTTEPSTDSTTTTTESTTETESTTTTTVTTDSTTTTTSTEPLTESTDSTTSTTTESTTDSTTTESTTVTDSTSTTTPTTTDSTTTTTDTTSTTPAAITESSSSSTDSTSSTTSTVSTMESSTDSTTTVPSVQTDSTATTITTTSTDTTSTTPAAITDTTSTTPAAITESSSSSTTTPSTTTTSAVVPSVQTDSTATTSTDTTSTTPAATTLSTESSSSSTTTPSTTTSTVSSTHSTDSTTSTTTTAPSVQTDSNATSSTAAATTSTVAATTAGSTDSTTIASTTTSTAPSVQTDSTTTTPTTTAAVSNVTSTSAANPNDTTTSAAANSTAAVTTTITTTTAKITSAANTTVNTTTNAQTTTTALPAIIDVPMSLKLNMNVSSINLTNTNSTEYVTLRDELENTLFDIFVQVVRGLSDVVVTKLSQGSLIADFNLVLNTSNYSNFQAAQSEIFKGVSNLTSSIKVGNQSYSVLSGPCDILKNVCTQNQICVNSSSGAVCQDITTTAAATTITTTKILLTTTPASTASSNCQKAGQGYSWVTKSCQPCGSDEYNDGTRNYCRYCPATVSATKDSCSGSSSKTIQQVDVTLTFDYNSISCQITDDMVTKGQSILQNISLSSSLCSNLPNCDNLVFQVNKQELCRLGSKCSQSANCTDFISRATLTWYNVPQYVNVNGDLRKTIEGYLEFLSNVTYLDTVFTKMNIVVNLPPVFANSSLIPTGENRIVFIKASLNVQLDDSKLKSTLSENTLKELGQIISTYLYLKLEGQGQSSSTQTNFTASLVFKVAVNDEIISAVAEALATSHEQFGGKFGDTSYSFTGPIAIFKSKADMDNSKSALQWCTFLTNLQAKYSFPICNLDSNCANTATYYECVSSEDPLKKQRDLYPYGPGVKDSQVAPLTSYWWWSLSSNPIYFASGAPFGDRKIKQAFVQANGVIRFGNGYDAWWPYFYYDPSYQEGLLAPYWSYFNYYTNNGTTYYQLYETAVVGNTNAVIQRASSEIKEFFKLSSFKVTSVLVATWVNVEPYKWYSWICEYYVWYSNEQWFREWYSSYYDQYCLTTKKETSTFQAVYVTDGETGYAIVTYKKGEMKWTYEQWTPIAVGFSNSEKTRDYGVTYTDLTTKMDTLTWNTGRYGTWIEQVGKIENPDGKCSKFYTDNKYLLTDKTHQANIKKLYQCPCSLGRLGAQWWGYSWTYVGGNTNMYCVAIGQTAKNRFMQGNPLNKLCCYRYTYPSNWWDWYAWDMAWRSAPYVDHRNEFGGHLLLNDPWWWWWGNDARKSREEDFNPHRWCCVDSSSPSKFCAMYNQVRPDLGCSLNAEFVSGSALGDPHITTLDGREYTMNGKGEFIMVTINEQNVTLEARTKQALTADGNSSKATVFSAFALKDGDNAFFQVELSADEKSMIINSCGADLTKDFYANENYTGSDSVAEVQVTRKDNSNKTHVVASFPSGVSIDVYVVDNYLEFTTAIPKAFKGKCLGLLGNFNDNPNDDFVLPDGTILSASDTDTERKIYEKFAKKWIVTSSNTIFKYREGENATTYQFFSFQPFFLEEANATDRAVAEKICENNTACVFDLLATGNEKFAITTLSSSSQASSAAKSLNNNLPVLNITTILDSNNRLQVYEGQQVIIEFKATDADKEDTITFELAGNMSSSFSINNLTGAVTYIPKPKEPVLIGVQAKDSKGGLSSIIYVNLVVCPKCSSNGSCDLTKTREKEYEGGKFLLNLCNCWPAYTGEDCEQEFNACLSAPCKQGQNCTDYTAARQKNDTIGYDCGSCPTGYEQRNSTCTDINECVNITDYCGANELCENSMGSYRCYCANGYRKDAKSICSDINECAERIHDCQQICNNTAGGYSCSCYEGNTLKNDNKTCAAPDIKCNCSHICKSNGGCACRSGYQAPSPNALDCVDIDECTSGNKPCSQACQNTDGGFKCSCYTGYKLGADGVSCTKCDSPYYGKNCASQCICNGLGKCDNVKGCVCNAAWTGTNCDKDVDECATNDKACSQGQICTNALGSFTCSCPSGYVKKLDVCTDIDECADVLTHNCSLAVEDCVNNQGGYSCECRSGYARNPKTFVCEDIDECAKRSDNCEQICVNVPGRFSCDCRYGYRLRSDRATCIEDKDVCASFSKSVINCTQFCTVNWTTNVPSCFCKSGYELIGRENCVDIDECKFEYLNLCGYKPGCINTPGGYNCSCLAGQMLDNDGRSCVSCGSGKWGINCANDCACGIGATSCDPKTGCVCKTGFQGEKCDKDVDECKAGLLKCAPAEECYNTFGSAECRCLKGYTRVNNECQDNNECAFPTTNDCDQLCENFVGGYACKCNQGYIYNSTLKKCLDIDECKLNMDGCQQGCENTDGGYRCICPAGLKLKTDGKTCEVDKTCTHNICEGFCYLNSSGGEVCYCQLGQQVNSTNSSDCEDVDLCATDACTDFCSETNNNQSYICSCPNGEKLEADGISCTACLEGFYGVNCTSKCSCNPATTEACDKVDGNCTCKSGYEGSDCATDKDECSSSSTYNCSANSLCENIPGYYVCKCQAGYFKENETCTACPTGWYGVNCISQCKCDTSHSTCDSATGNCNCDPGWTGIYCDTNIDECTSTDNNCTKFNNPQWVCFDTPGSYKCDCAKGYNQVDIGNCTDLNECAAASTNECDQNCNNTLGSYICSCNSGYKLGSDNHTCQDVDECTASKPCEQICTNNLGGYTCSCKEGYQVKTNNTNQCYKTDEYKMRFKIDIDVDNLFLEEKTHPDYINLKNEVEKELTVSFKKELKGEFKVLVTNLKKGSLIIDFIVIVDSVANPNSNTYVTNVVVNILANNFTLGNKSYSAEITINDMPVDKNADKCTILNMTLPCASNEKCIIDTTGNAVCVTKDSNSSDDIPLIVGLSVGLPLFAALVVAIILIIWYKKKYTQQRRVASREGHYQDDDRPPTRASNSYFAVAPVATDSQQGGKKEDKQSLFP